MQYFVVDYMLLAPLKSSLSVGTLSGWIQSHWSYGIQFDSSHEVPSVYGADSREKSFLDNSEVVDCYWSSIVTGFV